jgi:hypothetical protein
VRTECIYHNDPLKGSRLRRLAVGPSVLNISPNFWFVEDKGFGGQEGLETLIANV